MATTKSKKTGTETLKAAPVLNPAIENDAKKAPKKSVPITVGEVKDVVTPVDNNVKSATKKSKVAKTKVIRDSFSFPEQDYLKISQLKKTLLAAGIQVKKSELLRAGLNLLNNLNLAELSLAVEQVEKVQTGRPNASKK